MIHGRFGDLPQALQDAIAKVANDPASTGSKVKRRADALALPNLEVAHAYVTPRVSMDYANAPDATSWIDRIPGGWFTIAGAGLLGLVLAARGSR